MKYIAFIILFFAQKLNAQNHANIWHFSKNISLDFTIEPPKFEKNSMQNTLHHPVTTICDEKGKLLFYSDGITVWNHRNKIIKNGNHLKGDLAIVAVPIPSKKHHYYLFTVGVHPNPKSHPTTSKDIFTKVNLDSLAIQKQQKYFLRDAKISYSIVATNLNQGQGEVIEKNTLLYQSTISDICVARHANQKDYWLITHPFESDEFWVYLINEKGIQKDNIKSKIGKFYATDNVLQQNIRVTDYFLKSNISGNQLALDYGSVKNEFEIFDFDNSNGKVTQNYLFKHAYLHTWGLEFSPNGKKLYVGAYQYKSKYAYDWENVLVQFDLQNKNNQSINKSIQIKTVGSTALFGLQLAPNGKIYAAKQGENKDIAIIHHANANLNECNLELNAISIDKEIPYFNKFPKCTHLLPLELANEKKEIQLNVTFSRPILFETNQAIIKTDYMTDIDDIFQYLQGNPNTKIEIIGHTDNQGDKAQNQLLSEKRAKAVADYLISKGVHKNRIAFSGLGDAKPMADNNTIAGKAKNRRIEFLIK